MKILSLLPKHALNVVKELGTLSLNAFATPAIRPIQGEWCAVVIELQQGQQEGTVHFSGLWAHVNMLTERVELVHAEDSETYSEAQLRLLAEDEIALQSIERLMNRAFSYRQNYLPYGRHARLVYGQADGLSGLVIDGYVNTLAIQILTPGLDRFREKIKLIARSLMQEVFGLSVEAANSLRLFMNDQERSREREGLISWPVVPSEERGDLLVREGELELLIPASMQQKNGYYYDHRENRQLLDQKLTEWRGKKDNGLDLFCYAGAWGIGLLKAGVKLVDFVDQAKASHALAENLQRSTLAGRGVFHQADAFEFLSERVKLAQRYQVLVSDPPPFVKSPDKKSQALEGYKKLHTLLFQVCDRGALAALCSCSHYVSLEEFEMSAIKAARAARRHIRLLAIGHQSPDHPMKAMNDKANYLKMLLYLVE